MKTLLPLLMLLTLTGCATLNEQECRTLSPAQLGRRDGQQGYGLWRLDKHVASCARFGIGFDRDAYLAAREQGLKSYCTPDNGAIVGARGENYEGVCPRDLEPAFLIQYRPAYRDYLEDRRAGPYWYPWPLRH